MSIACAIQDKGICGSLTFRWFPYVLVVFEWRNISRQFAASIMETAVTMGDWTQLAFRHLEPQTGLMNVNAEQNRTKQQSIFRFSWPERNRMSWIPRNHLPLFKKIKKYWTSVQMRNTTLGRPKLKYRALIKFDQLKNNKIKLLSLSQGVSFMLKIQGTLVLVLI